MIISRGNLSAIMTGFQTCFAKGFENAPSYYNDIAMVITSSTREETYAWLGVSAPIREWIGPRQVSSLMASGYTIINKDFEKTIGVQRNDIEDDRIGLYGPMFELMGYETRTFPDEQIFGLLGNGFATPCYDEQNFFDTDHPVGMPGITPVTSVSNMQAGAGPAWFLMDCSKPIKPLIYQERKPFKMVAKDRDEDENVFSNKEYVYGVDGRSNCGYGFWQLAFGSKGTLDSTNYEAARVAMQSFKSDAGKPLAIKPTHLVVPPALEGDGLRILKALNPDGGTNEWAASTKLIVSPWFV